MWLLDPSVDISTVGVSSITVAEPQYGVAKSNRPRQPLSAWVTLGSRWSSKIVKLEPIFSATSSG